MRHLEPKQLERVHSQAGKRLGLYWAVGFMVVTLGLGWTGTHLFASSKADVVSQAERSERALLLPSMKPLTLSPVAAPDIDKALQTMLLDTRQQSELRKLVMAAPVVVPQSLAVMATGKPAAIPVSVQSPIKLVELTLWDTHAPDGDVVVVASAGYSREVVLSKQAETIVVPVAAMGGISVTGVRDGGGGITLGIRGAQQPLLMPILSEGQSIVLPVAP